MPELPEVETIRAQLAPRLEGRVLSRVEILDPRLTRPYDLFEVMEEEAHQPFQEVPDEWNARVDAFWGEVEARSE